MAIICSHTEYKGSDIELNAFIEGDYSNLSIEVYTDGQNKVSPSELTVSGDVITMYFHDSDLDILNDGVLRYDLHYTLDGEEITESYCTDQYLKTPGGYSALTPDDYYQSGYTAGYEAAQAKSVNLTQEEYDALEDKRCDTYYNIIEGD